LNVYRHGVDGEEALCRSRRLEPLHLALAPPHRLVRDLSAVVLSEPLFVACGQAHLAKGGAIGGELVRRDLRRSEARSSGARA